MSELDKSFMGVIGFGLCLGVLYVVLGLWAHSICRDTKPATEDRIERLERKIDQIHTIVVGASK